MFLFLWSLHRQSDKRATFVQRFPHVKQTYLAEYQITAPDSDTPADQQDFTTLWITDMKQLD